MILLTLGCTTGNCLSALNFLKILCLQKISDIISVVIGVIFFESQDISQNQNAIEGEFLSQKKLFSLLFAIFHGKKS